MNFSPAEIGTFLVGFAALLTAVYAGWGGRKRDKTARTISFTQMEDQFRKALYNDFKAQREENARLRKLLKEHEARIMLLEAEVENLERERERLTSKSKPRSKSRSGSKSKSKPKRSPK